MPFVRYDQQERTPAFSTGVNLTTQSRTIRAALLLLLVILITTGVTSQARQNQQSEPHSAIITTQQEPSEVIFPPFDKLHARAGVGQLLSMDASPADDRWIVGSTAGIVDGPQTGSPVTAVALAQTTADYAFATEGGIVVYHADQDRYTSHEGLRQPIAAIQWRPGTAQLTVGFTNGEIATFDTDTGAESHYGNALLPILDIAWSADGRRLAAGTDGGPNSEVVVWDARSDAPPLRLQGHQGAVRAVAFQPNSRLLASGADDAAILLWDAETGERQQQFAEHLTFITDLTFDKNGEQLVSSSFDGTVYWWDTRSGDAINTYRFDAVGVVAVNKFADHQTAALTTDNRIVIIDRETLDTHDLLNVHMGWVETVAAADDLIAGGTQDGSLVLFPLKDSTFDLAGFQQIDNYHEASIEGLAFTPDGSAVVSVSGLSNGTDYLGQSFPVAPEAPTLNFDGLHALAFSDAPARLATSTGTTIDVYNLASQGNTPAYQLEGHTALVLEVALTADGGTLASAAQDGSLRVWDVEQQTQRFGLGGFSGGFPTSVDINEQGTQIAVGTVGGVDIISLDGKPIKRLAVEEGITVADVAYDGDLLAAGLDDGRVIVWDTITLEERYQLAGHTLGVNSVAWSSTGVVSGSADGTISIWEITR